MTLWMTRMSMIETSEDLHPDQVAEALEDARSLLMFVMYGENEAHWKGNPSVAAWRRYPAALAAYHGIMAVRLLRSGIAIPTDHLRVSGEIDLARLSVEGYEFSLPGWFEDVDVLRSHRSNLARRWPKEYGDKWRGTPALMPYIWPFADSDGSHRLLLSKHDKALVSDKSRKLTKQISERISNL